MLCVMWYVVGNVCMIILCDMLSVVPIITCHICVGCGMLCVCVVCGMSVIYLCGVSGAC